MLTIGKVAARTKVTPDTLRYYEREGLLSPSGKTPGGYRLYDTEAVRAVHFIRRAQACGFLLAEIRELLPLRHASGVHCDVVRRRAQEKKLDLIARIRAMQAMCRILDELIAECGDDARAAGRCPILIGLERSTENQDKVRRPSNGTPRRRPKGRQEQQ
jgi:MerR family Zn(II)-responsive transcriptional regulator of zntA